jgi:hypothetical protein
VDERIKLKIFGEELGRGWRGGGCRMQALEHGNESWGSISGEYVEQLSDCQHVNVC